MRMLNILMLLMLALSYSSISYADIEKSNFKPSNPKRSNLKQTEQYFLAYKSKGKDYQPRTEHFNEDGTPKYINRLIFEESPYLIQHAHNPVNWYAWSPEAFAQAKKENKPIFLSIGYSTCHWCHVMERESFDNEAIAAYLNKHFIAIKVDRERRPDVDKTYMTALTLLNGSGGWPMSSLLTPAGKPFYAGTYYPPISFMQLLNQIADLWKNDEQRLRKIGDNIASAVQDYQKSETSAVNISPELIQLAVIQLMNRYDELQGGFSQAPKFPNETYLFLLLDTAIREQNLEILEALNLTMSFMAQGGIYDQIGGGFHRYAIDNEWLVPHFEKMLYNQGHLVRNYLSLYGLTHNINYKRIVEQTLNYVLSEMQTDDGVFYSAGDADSEGEEGKFFVWTEDEIQQLLTPELSKLALDIYAINKEGNFSENPMHEAIKDGEVGKSILHLPISIVEYAKDNQLDVNKLYHDIDLIRATLYQQREKRIAPAIDKKVVTAWNAMMITAFTQAGVSLQNSQYIDVAKKAADYIWEKHHYDASTEKNKALSGLWRVSLDGKVSVIGTQADYAYLAQAYLALYDATEEKIWLQRAEQLSQEMIQYFWDKEDGNFFMNQDLSHSDQVVTLFNRPKDLYDGAIPSANSIALEVLSQLYRRTDNQQYYSKAMAQIGGLSSQIKSRPTAFSYFLMAIKQVNSGEIAHIQYGGKGHVRLEMSNIERQSQLLKLEVKINIDKGWHINSRYPLDKDLIATSVNLTDQIKNNWKIASIEYPEGEEIKLNINDKPLSLYQNSNIIKVYLQPVSAAKQIKQLVSIPLQVHYQACSNSICLAPEMNTFYITP